jgi:hypothetical protein
VLRPYRVDSSTLGDQKGVIALNAGGNEHHKEDPW